MKTIKERNVQQALNAAMRIFKEGEPIARRYPSRNGPMIEIDEPVTTVYLNPRERVLTDPVRDANPYLHFFESLWMLAGRNGLAFLTQFSKNMANFSDDGVSLNGAYGFRWRHTFGRDQIDDLIRTLVNDPMTRRAVTSMWNPYSDWKQDSKDHPCNTHIYWRLRDSFLDMTVCNRSNDAIWGCYGANAVHFSFLQEYIACAIGAQVGTYRQVSNSLHIYPDLPVTQRMLAHEGDGRDMYREGCQTSPYLLGVAEDMWEFNNDLEKFFQDPLRAEYDTQFFSDVVNILFRSHMAYKHQKFEVANRYLDFCPAPDWKRACGEWLIRREKTLASKT